MSKALPRNKEGKKMYPVCSWEKNQHKIYNAHERAWLRQFVEHDHSDEAVAWYETVSTAYDCFDSCVINGIVYATWEEGQAIKDIIYGYDLRH